MADGESKELATYNVAYSMIAHGDVSGLSPEQRTGYYLAMCERYGLDPLLQPFNLLTLNGRVVLYANRAATDTIARKGRIQRQTVKHPWELTIGGKTVLACVARATMPDGRWEERIATVPMGSDLAVAIMKVETKAHRRATLAVAGMGLLDESELGVIRGAEALAKGASEAVFATCVTRALDAVLAAPELQVPRGESPDERKARNALESATVRESRVAAWSAIVDTLARDSSTERKVAEQALLVAVKKARE